MTTIRAAATGQKVPILLGRVSVTAVIRRLRSPRIGPSVDQGSKRVMAIFRQLRGGRGLSLYARSRLHTVSVARAVWIPLLAGVMSAMGRRKSPMSLMA